MDASHWTLMAAAAFAIAAAVNGAISLRQGERSKATFALMFGACIAECAFLYFRGQERGKCPLGDWGEILVFIAWSLSIFYMVIGPTYRVSLLGFFSAPFVGLLCAVALIPGMLEADPVRIDGENIDAWGELHAALSVLSYGALSLAMISAFMFLALNKKLKEHHIQGGLFKNLPPVFSLVQLTKRLLYVGVAILTVGILSSLNMQDALSHLSHLWTAVGVWVAYMIFILWGHFKGMTPKAFAIITVILFFASLIPFGLI